MRLSLLLVFCLFLTTAAFAQSKKAAPTPLSADAKAVEAAVVRFFDGMRASDSSMARSVLAPEARLLSVSAGKDGKVMPRETPINKFVEMIAQPHPQVLDERIWDVKVNIDGDLATLWCEYAFYVGDTFSHCGVDAFQLYRSPQGWKIFSITDTRRKEGCDLKAAQAAKSKSKP
ncbi:nuclear transport factor 2 family protein [Rufibacter latericius]|uniref:Nuclear transport factor 2 family protein n=1 Tax=Rufibacter latericius TaxID=2487040 RepID=A0A3M9MMW3_9BACT|nr:nuclear transport factor 2 family protein [Rufibacter latericius]RNI26008.1 nuclear transport factor 2 family protein [Rufibacter latericius]